LQAPPQIDLAKLRLDPEGERQSMRTPFEQHSTIENTSTLAAISLPFSTPKIMPGH